MEQKVELVRRNELDGAIKALNRDGWKIEGVTRDFAGVFLILCTKIKDSFWF